MAIHMPTSRQIATTGNLQPDERPNFWYRLTAAPFAPRNASLAARELSRRSRIASQIILGELISLLMVAIDLQLLRAALPSVLLALVCCLIAIALNRMGYLRATGWLLALSVDGALIWALLTAPGGLDPLYIPAYYLMLTAVLIVAAVLPSQAILPITLGNCIFIALDIRLQPHTMMWDQMVTSTGILYSMIVGPIALQVVAALLAYVWTSSATRALKRADRAEEIAQLERREAEQRTLLEDGVQQILATHVRFANGDLAARAPASQESALWQVSVALNNLLARYQRLAMEDGFSRMAAEQVGQARIALRIWQAGQPPAWPQPAGGPLDPLLADLRQLFTTLPPSRAPSGYSTPSAAYPSQPLTRPSSQYPTGGAYDGWPNLGEPPQRSSWSR